MRKHTQPEDPFKFFDRPAIAETPTAATNLQRAVWGETAILKHLRQTPYRYDESLLELLCSLMHWARFSGFDFDAALDEAKAQYDAEYES